MRAREEAADEDMLAEIWWDVADSSQCPLDIAVASEAQGHGDHRLDAGQAMDAMRDGDWLFASSRSVLDDEWVLAELMRSTLAPSKQGKAQRSAADPPPDSECRYRTGLPCRIHIPALVLTCWSG